MSPTGASLNIDEFIYRVHIYIAEPVTNFLNLIGFFVIRALREQLKKGNWE